MANIRRLSGCVCRLFPGCFLLLLLANWIGFTQNIVAVVACVLVVGGWLVDLFSNVLPMQSIHARTHSFLCE